MRICDIIPALSVAIAAAGAAQAQESPSVSFNLGAVSDYVFRGVSQTDEDPALQGGADLAAGPFYAGAWTSNVDFSPFGDSSTRAETDLYAGIKPQAFGFDVDLGAIYYGYWGQPKGAPDVDYWEAKAAASRQVGAATFGAVVYYSPQFTGEIGDAWYYEANAAYAIDSRWSVSGAVGRQALQTTSDYVAWSLGATFALAPHLSADLRYHDTDAHGLGRAYGSRATLALKASF